MSNDNHPRRGNSEEVGIEIAGRVAPYLSGVLPADFPQRLERLREASGLTWNAFADAIGIDKKKPVSPTREASTPSWRSPPSFQAASTSSWATGS